MRRVVKGWECKSYISHRWYRRPLMAWYDQPPRLLTIPELRTFTSYSFALSLSESLP